MHTYEVMDRSADEARLALRCGFGRFHYARALNALPPVGVALQGARPHLGFGILVCRGSGRIYRVIFEAVNETGPAGAWAGTWACESSKKLLGREAPGHA